MNDSFFLKAVFTNKVISQQYEFFVTLQKKKRKENANATDAECE
jgi:hypothetical protein